MSDFPLYAGLTFWKIFFCFTTKYIRPLILFNDRKSLKSTASHSILCVSFVLFSFYTYLWVHSEHFQSSSNYQKQFYFLFKANSRGHTQFHVVHVFQYNFFKNLSTHFAEITTDFNLQHIDNH